MEINKQNINEIIERMAMAIDLITNTRKEMTCRDIAKAALEASGLLNQWRDISDVPKNGTRILVYSKCGIYIVHWSDEAEFYQFEKKPGWQVFECEDGFYSISLEKTEPTHFMPLPSPPTTGASDDVNIG